MHSLIGRLAQITSTVEIQMQKMTTYFITFFMLAAGLLALTVAPMPAAAQALNGSDGALHEDLVIADTTIGGGVH